ncbi:MAG TPA: ABC transporter permease subunit, partial [Hyphomicrobiaceae bacterium]|nr:ABC transporter permease subunit [Hyphomicrobiaceae bacterium]
MRRGGTRAASLQEGAGFAALLAIVALLTSLPLGRLATAALAPEGRWSPANALAEISTKAAVQATWNTIEVGVLSGLGALVIGTLFAVLVGVTDVRGKRPLAFLFVLSLLVAPQVAALAFKSLLGPGSPLLEALGLALPAGTANPMVGRGGIIAVLALHHAPLVAVTLMPGLRAIPRTMIEAASLDGAGPILIARRILLPLLRHHLAAAGLLAFVAGAGNFGIPALLGLPANYLTLPTLIYRRLSSYGPSVLADVAALAMLDPEFGDLTTDA